jgi:hypothetical protein
MLYNEPLVNPTTQFATLHDCEMYITVLNYNTTIYVVAAFFP